MSAQTICTHMNPLKSRWVTWTVWKRAFLSSYKPTIDDAGGPCTVSHLTVLSAFFLKTNLRQYQDELFSWYADLLFCIVILYHQLQKRDFCKKSLKKKLHSFSYYIRGLELIKISKTNFRTYCALIYGTEVKFSSDLTDMFLSAPVSSKPTRPHHDWRL